MASYYRPDEQAISPPDFKVYALSDSLLRLYVRINTEHLLFTRQPDQSFQAMFGVEVDILGSYDQPTLLDSFSFATPISYADHDLYKVFSYELPLHASGDLLARLTLADVNKGSSEIYYQRFNSSLVQGSNAFVAMNDNGVPAFNDYFTAADTIKINFRDSAVHEVWCKYYQREFPLSAPPFTFDIRTSFDYTPDSVFKISVNDTNTVTFSTTGFYWLQEDTTLLQGWTAFCFDQGYPNVVTTAQMVAPLRYLTSRAEYAQLDTAASSRKAVDAFWLERSSGNRERAKLLIKKYYNRVQYANRLFSCHTQGWRTDRGMIYVVFGAPNIIYRYTNSETWIYGSENSPTGLNFLFVKVDNPFTVNDYSLTRSPIYESPWYRGIDFWRQGRAYNSIY